MKKIIQILLFSLLLISLSGCLTNLKLNSCDDLSILYNKEYKKLDFSCNSDNDCVMGSHTGCGCKKINANTKKLEQIYNLEIEKGCIPQVECSPYECKCVNNICTSEILPREEWGW